MQKPIEVKPSSLTGSMAARAMRLEQEALRGERWAKRVVEKIARNVKLPESSRQALEKGLNGYFYMNKISKAAFCTVLAIIIKMPETVVTSLLDVIREKKDD